MRILIDIAHPAHVHFFRLVIPELQNRGHKVAVTIRNTNIISKLLKNFDIPYTSLTTKGTRHLLAPYRLIMRDFLLWKYCLKFKPDLLTGIGGTFISHVGFMLRKPSILWDDTEHHKLNHRLAWPFATAIYSPDCYTLPPIKKQRLYPGCHELAYLHPNNFTPVKETIKKLGINPDEKYCIIRLSAWMAHHDIGQHGIQQNKTLDFAKTIEKYARVYISGEKGLPDELKKYQLNIPLHKIHHVMAFAYLCISEGATMASESAILGVPTIYINTLKLGYINMWENYGILKQTTDTEKALDYAIDSIKDPNSKNRANTICEKILSEKIDVKKFVVGTIENQLNTRLKSKLY